MFAIVYCKMVEEVKQAKELRMQMASSGPAEVPIYEQIAKKEPNDILVLWAQTFPSATEEPEEVKGEASKVAPQDDLLRQVSYLIRFMRAARTKKMLEFNETKAELTQKYKDFKATLCPSKPFELVYSDLEKLVECSDIKVVLEAI